MAASMLSVEASAIFNSFLASRTAASCLMISSSSRLRSFAAKAMYDDRILAPFEQPTELAGLAFRPAVH